MISNGTRDVLNFLLSESPREVSTSARTMLYEQSGT